MKTFFLKFSGKNLLREFKNKVKLLDLFKKTC